MTRFPKAGREQRESVRALLQRLAVIGLIAWSHEALAVNCTVSATPFNFGTYSTTSNLSVNPTLVTISCSGWAGNNSVSYTLSASPGSGSYSSRQLLNGTHGISYNLYTNPNDTTIWGDGNGDGTVTIAGTVTNKTSPVSITIYGLIRSGQNVPPGNYTTLAPITVTLTYQ